MLLLWFQENSCLVSITNTVTLRLSIAVRKHLAEKRQFKCFISLKTDKMHHFTVTQSGRHCPSLPSPTANSCCLVDRGHLK